MTNYKSVENLLAIMLCIHSFQCYKMEKSTKSISTVNPTITENTECLIVKACIPDIDLKVVCGVSKSYTEAIMCVPLIVTYAVVEKGMEHKGEQR